jgi:hypothetical protein
MEEDHPPVRSFRMLDLALAELDTRRAIVREPSRAVEDEVHDLALRRFALASRNGEPQALRPVGLSDVDDVQRVVAVIVVRHSGRIAS